MSARSVPPALFAWLLVLAACAADPQPDPGSVDGSVTVQVFSDPQCWACRQFYLENLRPALAEMGASGLKVVHHLYPLSYHEHAREAASFVLAGEKLGPGGRDRVLGAVFETQAEWAEDGDLAGALAPFFSPDELAVLERSAGSPEVAASLGRDTVLARRNQVSGVPVIYVLSRGERHRVPSTVQYPIFRRYLHSRLEP